MLIHKLLPFKHYIIITRLPSTEVYKRIHNAIEPFKKSHNAISGIQSTKPYQGQLAGNSFTISRIVNNKNSFLPIIYGDVAGFSSHTQVQVEIKLTRFVLIFTLCWLSVIGLICLGILLAGVIQYKQIIQHGFTPLLLIPFGMFIAGFLLFTLPFKLEIRKSIHFLELLLDGKAVAA